MAFLINSIVLYFIVGIAGVVGQESFIYGGSDATPGQIPYQVSLRTSSNSHYCGGAIIDIRWILTTAYCIETTPGSVVIGSLSLSSGGVSYSIDKVIAHPSYDSNYYKDDIGLIKTVGNIAFNEFAQPIKISLFDIGANVQATFSGWGFKTPGTRPDKLQVLLMTTMTNEDCVKTISDAGYVHPNSICAVNATGSGPCTYDDGGPLARDRTLHGLYSWGQTCGGGFPEVYTKVQPYKYWIWWTKFTN